VSLAAIDADCPRRGFTLIELLVVIAIVAILAAILFPVFAQAKAAARKSTCLSNQKQINVGWVLYAQDYDDTMCQYSYQNMTDYRSWHWAYYYDGQGHWDPEQGLLQPYLKSSKLYDCPDARSLKFWRGQLRLGFGINIKLAEGDQTPSGDYQFTQPVTYGGVDRPAETLLGADTLFVLGFGTPTQELVYDDLLAYGGWPETAHGRHGGLANTAWLDGHVRSMPVTPPSMTDPLNGGLSAEYQKQNHLGWLLKFPLEEPSYNLASPRNTFYYDLQKGDGL